MVGFVMRRDAPAALISTLAACSGGGSTLPNLASSVTPVLGTVRQTTAPQVASTPLSGTPAEPTGAFAKAPLLPPSDSIYLGARVSPGGSSSPANVAAFESQIGRKLALDLHYRNWNQSFPAADELDDEANGRIPVESWNCSVSNEAVASGSQDVIIDARAAAIKSFAKPLFLRYLWDMNLPVDVNGREGCFDPNTDLTNGFLSPTQYVRAWSHIRARFAADGVTNVVWLWNPSVG
jgi:hypothetical protein